MKLLIVNNLSSGYGDGAIYDFMRSFSQDGDEIVVRSSNGTTDVSTFLDDADDFDLVVVSGGDGTISSVAHQLMHTGIPVLPFPAGTGNLLTLNLLSPNEPHALAKMAREGETLDFDFGEITFPDGSTTGFSVMAGAGYDATIMGAAMPTKKLLGPMAYFSAAFANPMPQFSKLRLVIDGKTIETEGIGVLIINFAKLQFDIPVVHENLPRDGAFDIVVMNTKDALGLIPVLFATILDRGGDFPHRTDAVEIYQGHEVYLEADPPLQVQYDGEVSPHYTPFMARLWPQSVSFVVSEEGVDLYGDTTPSLFSQYPEENA